MDLVLLNVAYAVYTASSIFSSIVRLRIVLLIATVLFIAYGVVADSFSLILWNVPFGVLHVYKLYELWNEHRLNTRIGENDAYRTLLFPSLSRVDFERLWSSGAQQTVSADSVLVAAGEHPTHVHLIVDGEAEVRTADRAIRLGRLSLVGEMSLLRGLPASASVAATVPTTTHAWEQGQLVALWEEHGAIREAFLLLIGRDLITKLD